MNGPLLIFAAFFLTMAAMGHVGGDPAAAPFFATVGVTVLAAALFMPTHRRRSP